MGNGKRIREIGLRRTIGALRRDIHTQFLFESGLLAGTGGVIRVLGGVGAAWATSALGYSEKCRGPRRPWAKVIWKMSVNRERCDGIEHRVAEAGGRVAAVLNDCEYGVSVLGSEMGLTLLKSAMAALDDDPRWDVNQVAAMKPKESSADELVGDKGLPQKATALSFGLSPGDVG